MDNYLACEWDYLGWRKSNFNYAYKTWNNTILTAIGVISDRMHDKTKHGGVDVIKINENTFRLFEELDYLFIDEKNKKNKLARFDLVIDNTVPTNKVFLFGREYEYLKKHSIVKIYEQDDISKGKEVGVFTVTMLFETDERIKEYQNKPGATIISPETLFGEITIINYDNR